MKDFLYSKLVRSLVLAGGASALMCLAGCATVGPDYVPPSLKVPADWHAALPHEGSTTNLLHWWAGFNDPALDLLLRSAESESPTLGQAAGAIAAARASREQAAADLLPKASAGAGLTRSGTSRLDNPNLPAGSTSLPASATTRSGGLDASWEVDLFGSIRRSEQAAMARLQARQAEWHDARISLAAEVGSEYINFRACQVLLQLQQRNLASLRKTADSTKAAVDQELMAPAESTLAAAGVANAQASLRAQRAECDLGIKALVALTGIDEPGLRQTLAKDRPAIPMPPELDIRSVPVQLLSQRPDLVAAERSLAAASADIGVAEANRYPRLSLLGSISVSHSDTQGSGVSTAPWSFGPSLSLPLFDGGRLRAQVASARAGYQTALANYRGRVRTAVREAEQALVRLDAATRRSEDIANAAAGYRRYFDAAERNWTAGGINLLSLEEARRNALQAEQADISTRRDRVLDGIALYKALGGGWQRTDNMTVAGVSQ
ncbi:efflux transporter outer membrane subunit [Massilia luteola]|uniref:efflux transporter outer membrane subunit n=1 Tax=Massilia luteola TaxID=3081751 RepID=UPI002ACC372C|nr:efflux transporter outer membrane subunit [Massilia sp. Gc5]